MKSALWVVQNNLGNEWERSQILRVLDEHGIRGKGVPHIPFSEEPPDVARDYSGPVIFYGAVGMVQTAFESGYWSPCAFYDPERFTYEAYMAGWEDAMLNADGRVVALKDFVSLPFDYISKGTGQVHIRPVSDLKSFSGDVVEVDEAVAWLGKIDSEGILEPDTPLWVSAPKRIEREWRCFVVDGRVVTGTQYRRNGRLDVESGLPDKVKRFCRNRAAFWLPHRVCVVDVCEVGGDLRIVEAGCFNSAGLYGADIEALVLAVTRWVEENAS